MRKGWRPISGRPAGACPIPGGIAWAGFSRQKRQQLLHLGLGVLGVVEVPMALDAAGVRCRHAHFAPARQPYNGRPALQSVVVRQRLNGAGAQVGRVTPGTWSALEDVSWHLF